MKNKTIFLMLMISTHLSKYPASETIGSDLAVSRETHHVFDGFDNKIAGFAAMEEGFSYLNETTTCTFDSLMPVKQQIDINNGMLFLNKNLNIEDEIDIKNPGRIYGNNHNIIFSSQTTLTDNNITLTIPTIEIGTLTLIDSTSFPSQPYTLEWSYDNHYHVIGAGNTIYIFNFHDNVITQTASVNTGGLIYSIRFRPGTYEIACGNTNGLSVYKWNKENGTISLQDSTYVGGTVKTLGWSNDGEHIAFLRQANPELQVYSYDGSSLTYVAQSDIAGGSPRGIAIDTLLSWRGDGQYIATGFASSSSEPELYVHEFNGTSLTLSASAETSQYIISMDWCQTNSLIAVGLFGSTERLRVFEHNATDNSLKEVQSARLGITSAVQTVSWKKDGGAIAYAQNNSSEPEFKIYKFNNTNRTFSYETGYDISPRTGYNIRWSNNVPDSNELFFAGFDNNSTLYILDIYTRPFYFDKTNIFFNSDILLRNEAIFSGNCIIEGNNNTLFLLENEGKITVTANSTLIISNITIDGVSVDNLNCYDSSGKIIFKNVSIQADKDLYFYNGSFEVYEKLKFFGPKSFNYISDQESIIHSNSKLKFYDDATLSYTTKSTKNNLIIMEDSTSTIVLNNSSIDSTTTAIHLTTGKLKIKGICNISSNGNNEATGIIFGDGIFDSNDLNIEITSNSEMNISGYVIDKNLNH